MPYHPNSQFCTIWIKKFLLRLRFVFVVKNGNITMWSILGMFKSHTICHASLIANTQLFYAHSTSESLCSGFMPIEKCNYFSCWNIIFTTTSWRWLIKCFIASLEWQCWWYYTLFNNMEVCVETICTHNHN